MREADTIYRCPACGYPLVVEWRVKEVRVPGTVPEHLRGSERAVYERRESWEEVVCRNGHHFKQQGRSLTGMG